MAALVQACSAQQWRLIPITGHCMKRLFVILLFLLSSIAMAIDNATEVIVYKEERIMILMSGDREIARYDIVLGGNPEGHKQQEGDQRTPEGEYVLDYKKADSAYYKAIHISYPNERDKANAQKMGVNPGGFIMIHGQKNGFEWAELIAQQLDWTEGCIAVKNAEMDEIWEAVDAGTPIAIHP